MKRFFNWLADRISPRKSPPRVDLSRTGQHQAPKKKGASGKPAVPRSQPEYIDFDANVDGQIDSAGPGKNVLKRSKHIRDETSTHETLTIIDESVESGASDDDGIDPYNTGQFDRSKNWDKRFRKD